MDVPEPVEEMERQLSRFMTYFLSSQPDWEKHFGNIILEAKPSFKELRLEKENGQIFVTLSFGLR
jgi:hypothetical protein